MKRLYLALVLMAVVTVALTGCGGGGGGGGGGTPPDTTPRTTLSGRVFDTNGTPISGATVTVDSGTVKAIVSTTTNANGQYSIGNIPKGVLLNIQISKTGITTTIMNGLTIGLDAGSAVGMDIVANSQGPPVGSTVSLSPTLTDIYTGDTLSFDVVVKNSVGDPIYPTSGSGWQSSLVVSGAATGHIQADSPGTFSITGGTVGQTAKITVLVIRSDGSIASTSTTVTIKNMEGPPPPPI